MKAYIILFAIIFCVHLQTNGQKGVSQNTHKRLVSKGSILKVIKIDSINNVYVIYAKKKSITYKIVSKKDSSICNSIIMTGKSYNFKLYSLFHPGIVQRKSVSAIRYEKTIIDLEGNGILWDLFVSDNLKGLCYIK